MSGRSFRAAVVGASTLLGKELADELNGSSAVAWDLALLDTTESGGQITSAGDEALVMRPVSAESFASVDVVFFASDAATAREHWKAAHAAGAGIVDLTGELEGMPGVVVRSAWMDAVAGLDLATVAVVAAHPMSIVLALVESRLRQFGLQRLVATVLLPASELGSAGVDELQQQAIGLLTFKPLQKDVYDAQVAFNLLSALGTAANLDMQTTRAAIVRQATALGAAPGRLALHVVQAPVFHGLTASVYLETASTIDEGLARKALAGELLRFATETEPSNESAAGAGEVLLSLQKDGDGAWLWMAADNLRLAARNAAGCAVELALLRPSAEIN